ncbi:esterase/lipase family protein [Mesorhizobium japonicum]|uniref:esterase/lipase family protein n=1 Tax=Mesorhizobium japonicum TaxID=2066070 RepID=UPI003B5AD8A8
MTDVVLVSGGAAVTPFTTPDRAARSGLAAGNTMTALRTHLLAEGHRVFTAPARIGAGVVTEDTGWQGFGEVDAPLPAELTINAVGTLDDAGTSLHAFLQHLAEQYGVTEAVLVAHSMGGLFSRAAIGRGVREGTAVSIRGLVTLGTPWTGSLLGDHLAGSITTADAHGDEFTERVLSGSADFARENSQGAAEQVSADYLTGPDGWNARQAGLLEGIPVTVIAGDHFDAFDSPDRLWPHDGLVQQRSALAIDVPEEVMSAPERAVFPDVHSIFFADAVGLPWERGLTWDPDVAETVSAAITRYAAPRS